MRVVTGAVGAVALLAVVGGAAVLAPQPAPEGAAPRPPVGAAMAAARVEYGWPTGEPGAVLRAFAAPPARWAAGHRGVDLELSAGEPVRAAADGVVAFAGTVAGRGVVSIDHDDGVRTTYEPVTGAVGRGEPVLRGDVVGTLAEEAHHCAPLACLHWGARRGADEYLDPMLLLAQDVVIRLLPGHRP